MIPRGILLSNVRSKGEDISVDWQTDFGEKTQKACLCMKEPHEALYAKDPHRPFPVSSFCPANVILGN